MKILKSRLNIFCTTNLDQLKNKPQTTSTSSPNVKTQEKSQHSRKQESTFGPKFSRDSGKASNHKKQDNHSAYLPELEGEGSVSLNKKKAQLEKEINKIFSDKLPDIRLSVFK